MSAHGDGVVFLAPLRSCIDPDRAASSGTIGTIGSATGALGFEKGFGPRAGELALVVAALDAEGFRNAMQLAVPTIPPMTRAPFTNYIPDFVAVGSSMRAKGTGGFHAAGYFGNSWEWCGDASYAAC
jgi:hypothetical protein